VRIVGTHISGSAIDVAFLNVFQVADGKIVNLWMYFDSGEMARQLGR
jgi:predicted ester cyclase